MRYYCSQIKFILNFGHVPSALVNKLNPGEHTNLSYYKG